MNSHNHSSNWNPESIPPGPDLDISNTARVLGTTTATVKRLLAEGKLQAYQLFGDQPRGVRIRRESVIAMRNQVLPQERFTEGSA